MTAGQCPSLSLHPRVGRRLRHRGAGRDGAPVARSDEPVGQPRGPILPRDALDPVSRACRRQPPPVAVGAGPDRGVSPGVDSDTVMRRLGEPAPAGSWSAASGAGGHAGDNAARRGVSLWSGAGRRRTPVCERARTGPAAWAERPPGRPPSTPQLRMWTDEAIPLAGEHRQWRISLCNPRSSRNIVTFANVLDIRCSVAPRKFPNSQVVRFCYVD